MPADKLPVRAFATAAEWHAWLEDEHARSAGVWLQIAKGGSPMRPTVTYAEALESALCFGWIDGQKRPLDDDFWLQRFSPRKPGSKWSKINTVRAEALIAAGRMHPAGLAEVERAKADGRWERAYAGQASASVPDDLREALAANPAAAAFFETISGANRYAIIYRIGAVKRPETRTRKINEFVQMLAERRTIHPQARSGGPK
ncbi:MAG TPA: YdeI/OmpD-associated family protein [Streptosporangiaceae bacterium]|jgi:uncharacterized protein YdeI (YjbR/CyaY-like superfamily)